MVSRSSPRFSLNVVRSLSAILLGALGLVDGARADGHSSFDAFQAGARSGLFFQTFGGPIEYSYPVQSAAGNGYAYTVSTTPGHGHLFRSPRGIGPEVVNDAGIITFSGGPVTAFGATFFTENNMAAPIDRSMTVRTDTGETYIFPVPATGAFFGVTSSRPFSTLQFFRGTAESFWVKMDNVYVGVSGSASTPTDQCTDAPTVAGVSVQVPFSTTGATAESVPGSCAGLDNGPDVWVRYVASATGSVTMSTCGCTFDSILRVFDSCGGSQVACNDDFCATSAGANHASQVQYRVVAGEDYLVRISGFDGASGNGVLTITAASDCASDFNHSGQANVQDIFDFLTAWFAGCP